MSARQAHWRMLTLTAAVCGCLLWVVVGGGAHAEDLSAEDHSAEDPKAAARAIGSIGNAAAGTIARDSSNAATVPGYAGTGLPERAIRADALEDAARRRLADPDNPGGVAG